MNLKFINRKIVFLLICVSLFYEKPFAALYREIYNRTGHTSNLIWKEDDGQNALDLLTAKDSEVFSYEVGSRITYNVMKNVFNIDSIQNSGKKFLAVLHLDTVNFAPNVLCPDARFYEKNALGYFCDKMATIEWVGHEIGHGYGRTAWFSSTGEGKIIGEAYADLLGMTVKLVALGDSGKKGDYFGDEVALLEQKRSDDPTKCSKYGEENFYYIQGKLGTDDSSRWLFGSRSAITARDFWNPHCFNSPVSVCDPFYYKGGTPASEHMNNAIFTHAFALLVDGGTFHSHNGVSKSITAIGLEKAFYLFFKPMFDDATDDWTFSKMADDFENRCTLSVGNQLLDLASGNTINEYITTSDCDILKEVIELMELRKFNQCPSNDDPSNVVPIVVASSTISVLVIAAIVVFAWRRKKNRETFVDLEQA